MGQNSPENMFLGLK